MAPSSDPSEYEPIVSLAVLWLSWSCCKETTPFARSSKGGDLAPNRRGFTRISNDDHYRCACSGRHASRVLEVLRAAWQSQSLYALDGIACSNRAKSTLVCGEGPWIPMVGYNSAQKGNRRMLLISYFGGLLATVAYSQVLIWRAPRQFLFTAFAILFFTPLAVPAYLLPVSGLVTALQLSVLGCMVIWRVLIRSRAWSPRSATRYLLALGLLILLCIIYLGPTSNLSYGVFKISQLLLRAVLPLIVLVSLGPLRRSDVQALFGGLVIGSMLGVLGLLVNGDAIARRMSVSADVHPISIARDVGIGATLLLAAVLGPWRGKQSWVGGTVYRLVGLAVVFLMFTAIFLTGSRGPAVAGIAAAILVPTFFARSARMRLRYLVNIAVTAIVFMVVINFVPSEVGEIPSVARALEYIASPGSNSSDQERIERLAIALNVFRESNFIGAGTGAYGAFYGWGDREYPHNVIFEAAAELGIPGLIVVSGLLVGPFLHIFKRRTRREGDLALMMLSTLYVYFCVNAMVTGDFATNSLLWVSGGLVCMFDTNSDGQAIPPLPVRKFYHYGSANDGGAGRRSG